MKIFLIIIFSVFLSTIFTGSRIQAPRLKPQIPKHVENQKTGCQYEIAINEYYQAYFYGQNRPDLAKNKVYRAKYLVQNCGEESRVLINRIETLIKVLSP